MADILPQGKELIYIIEGHDWLLYNVTQSSEQNRAFTWEEIQEKTPAKQIEMDNNYIFAPRPENGQTLREAYSITKGLGPSLTIEDTDDSRWIALRVGQKKFPGCVALFSRLFFEEQGVVATSPKTIFIREPDIVAMPYESVIESFQKYFRIVQPEEIEAETPIPMPFRPDSN